MTPIPYGRQDVTDADVDAVVDVLRSDYLTQGPEVPRFEEAVSAYTGAHFGVAVNSATSALHLACLALGLGPGDLLWTSPISFVASANCARYCGADVDFVDIDHRTYNLSVDALTAKLDRAERDGKLPKIVLPVHLAGQSCDMRAIRSLADEYGFAVIEDASHAVGGRYRGEPVGSCTYSDIAVFSFHPVKIITTGEGGVALTNQERLAARMRDLRSHGITRDESRMTRPADGPWYYEQLELGFNYRMTDIQASLGRSQLSRIDDYVTRRHEIARRYDQALEALPFTPPWQHPDTYSAYHLYVARLPREASPHGHREVFEGLREQGIQVNLHYIPIHLQPYYRALGFRPGDLPEAERYYGEAISLPMFPLLTVLQQEQVISALTQTLAE
jgi:UDP-4-amino-4,6-dideoxy-N-acetyl-beta-L-altrosamine transaminase